MCSSGSLYSKASDHGDILRQSWSNLVSFFAGLNLIHKLTSYFLPSSLTCKLMPFAGPMPLACNHRTQKQYNQMPSNASRSCAPISKSRQQHHFIIWNGHSPDFDWQLLWSKGWHTETIKWQRSKFSLWICNCNCWLQVTAKKMMLSQFDWLNNVQL